MDGDGGRLSAAEKGKQKAADDADLPAALVLGSEGEPRPTADAVANCYGDGGGSGVPLPRRLLIPPRGTSEIEDAPPSPPPAAPSRLPALNAADAGTAVVGLKSSVMELQPALEGRLRELQQPRRESEGSKGEASKRRREGADEPGPEVAGGAEVQALQHQLSWGRCTKGLWRSFGSRCLSLGATTARRIHKWSPSTYLGGAVHRSNKEVTADSMESSNVGRSEARSSGSNPNEKETSQEEITSSMASYLSRLLENLRTTWNDRQKVAQEKDKEMDMKVVQVQRLARECGVNEKSIDLWLGVLEILYSDRATRFFVKTDPVLRKAMIKYFATVYRCAEICGLQPTDIQLQLPNIHRKSFLKRDEETGKVYEAEWDEVSNKFAENIPVGFSNDEVPEVHRLFDPSQFDSSQEKEVSSSRLSKRSKKTSS